MSKTTVVISLPTLARRLKIHRTTLLRYEQRGVIPEAKRTHLGRVYTPEDIREVEARIKAYHASRFPTNEGEYTVDSDKLG